MYVLGIYLDNLFIYFIIYFIVQRKYLLVTNWLFHPNINFIFIRTYFVPPFSWINDTYPDKDCDSLDAGDL